MTIYDEVSNRMQLACELLDEATKKVDRLEDATKLISSAEEHRQKACKALTRLELLILMRQIARGEDEWLEQLQQTVKSVRLILQDIQKDVDVVEFANTMRIVNVWLRQPLYLSN